MIIAFCRAVSSSIHSKVLAQAVVTHLLKKGFKLSNLKTLLQYAKKKQNTHFLLTLFDPHLVPVGTIPISSVPGTSTATLHVLPPIIIKLFFWVIGYSFPPEQYILPHFLFLQKEKNVSPN